MVDGTPTLVVSEGEFLMDNMDGVRVSSEEVYSEMHQAGLSRLDQIRRAALETDGKIRFIPYERSESQARRSGSKEPLA